MWTDEEMAKLHARAMKRRRNGERTGQSYYNAAYAMNPGVAQLAMTDCDPFMDDTKLGAFLSRLRGAPDDAYDREQDIRGQGT